MVLSLPHIEGTYASRSVGFSLQSNDTKAIRVSVSGALIGRTIRFERSTYPNHVHASVAVGDDYSHNQCLARLER